MGGEGEDLVESKGWPIASAEVSAGAVAKADQNTAYKFRTIR